MGFPPCFPTGREQLKLHAHGNANGSQTAASWKALLPTDQPMNKAQRSYLARMIDTFFGSKV